MNTKEQCVFADSNTFAT